MSSLIKKTPVGKTTKDYTQRFDVDVDDTPKPKSRKQDLPSRNDVSDLCDLAAAVYHTDIGRLRKDGTREPPSRGRVYNMVTRVRAKLEGLP